MSSIVIPRDIKGIYIFSDLSQEIRSEDYQVDRKKAGRIRIEIKNAIKILNKSLCAYNLSFLNFSLSADFSDDHLLSERGLVQVIDENIPIMTEDMADNTCFLICSYLTEIYQGKKTSVLAEKDTQAGKTRDIQNFVISMAAILDVLRGEKIYPIVVLPSDKTLEQQFTDEDWYIPRDFFKCLIISNTLTGRKKSVRRILAEWETAPDKWVMRRAAGESARSAFLEKVDRIYKERRRILVILDEIDHGSNAHSVLDKWLTAGDFYRQSNGMKCFVGFSATEELTFQQTQQFSHHVKLKEGKGYSSWKNRILSMSDFAHQIGVPELPDLGGSVSLKGSLYCSALAYVKKVYPDIKKDEISLLAASSDEQHARYRRRAEQTIIKTLLKFPRRIIIKDKPVDIFGIMWRFVNSTSVVADLLPKLRKIVGNKAIVIPWTGFRTNENVRLEDRKYHKKRLKDAIRFAYAQYKIEYGSRPILILITHSARRGAQIPDGIAHLDQTGKPDTQTSGLQNAGRSSGYKNNSVFVPTDTYYDHMHGKKYKRLKPSRHACTFRIPDQRVLELRRDETFPEIRNVFRRIDMEVVNRPAHLQSISKAYKNGNIPKNIMGGKAGYNKSIRDDNPMSDVRDILDDKFMSYIEDNHQRIIRSGESPSYDVIRLLRYNKSKTPPWNEEYDIATACNGQSFGVVGLRSDDTTTNLVWSGKPQPQIHYTICNGKMRCVKIALRLTEAIVNEEIYGKIGSIAHKASGPLDRLRAKQRLPHLFNEGTLE